MRRGDMSLETIGLWALLALALFVGFIIIRSMYAPGTSMFDPILALFSGFD